LLAALEDSDSWVRRAALIRLKKHPVAADRVRIAAMLDDENASARSLAAIVCKKWGVPQFARFLIHRLDVEEDYRVIVRIVDAVATLETSESHATLTRMMTHTSFRVREAASNKAFLSYGVSALRGIISAYNASRTLRDIWYVKALSQEDFDSSALPGLLRSTVRGEAVEPETAAFVLGLFLSLMLETARPIMISMLLRLLPHVPSSRLSMLLAGMRASWFQGWVWKSQHATLVRAAILACVRHSDERLSRPAAYLAGVHLRRFLAAEARQLEHLKDASNPALLEEFSWGLVRSLPERSRSAVRHDNAYAGGAAIATLDGPEGFDDMDDDIPF
jgi:hypothetical protein